MAAELLIAIILSIGLIVSAFLAVHLEEAIYSVGSLAVTLILLAIVYWVNSAPFAAIFQLVAGISTLMVLFLAGEMLSEKTKERDSRKRVLGAIIIALIVSLPTVLLTAFAPSATSTTTATSPPSFTGDIWDLRSVDIVLQGLVILVIAVGVAVILYHKKVEAAAVAKKEA